MLCIKKLNLNNLKEVSELFVDIFMSPPWNDDWSDENQLQKYLMDLMGNQNSLAYGLYDQGELIGFSLGNIKHWWAGTEYCIDEFCVSKQLQGKGCGTKFIELLIEQLREDKIVNIYLQTDRNVKAYEFYQKNGFIDMTDHASLFRII